MGGGAVAPAREEGSARAALNATAGAIAGAISRFLIGPLDVIKIRFQVQLEPIRFAEEHAAAHAARAAARASASKYTGFLQAFNTILKEEGIQGLWRGTVPGVLLTVPYTAVQFLALHQLKDLAASYGLADNPSTSTLVSLGSGAMAGAAGTVASYPFDLLRTTMAAQGEPKVYRNMFHAARSIVADRGLVGLYSGLGVTVLEIMPYAALQFGVYDSLRAAWDRSKQLRKPPGALPGSPAPVWHDPRVSNFVCGLMAGLVAKLVTHPLDVAKKRYQVAGLQRSLRYGARVQPTFAMQSLAAGLAQIYRTEGVAGLWKGSVPSIVKAAPAAAITFTAYEAVMAWLVLLAEPQQTKTA